MKASTIPYSFLLVLAIVAQKISFRITEISEA
jgi:hypothetical protein